MDGVQGWSTTIGRGHRDVAHGHRASRVNVNLDFIIAASVYTVRRPAWLPMLCVWMAGWVIRVLVIAQVSAE
tara:strand:+ start:290 stop:505 length:216 start_codon:yes stop_codon:yes gene_type:complete